MSSVEQSGRISLRRPKPPVKGGSASEEEDRQYEVAACVYFTIISLFHILRFCFFINACMVVFLCNTVIYVFLLLCLYILIVFN